MSIRNKISKSMLWTILSLAVATTTLSSCYNNREAKRIVKDFLDTNLKSTNYNTEYFSEVDSTFVVSDSVLHVMQDGAKKFAMFKAIKFGERGKERKLNYIKVRYTIGADTIKQIFYIDSSMKHVVAVKSDF